MSRKMSCAEVLAQLLVYLDNEVDETTDADIEAHLHECRECYSRAEFEKRLRRKVAESGTVKAPEDVRKRLQAMIKKF